MLEKEKPQDIHGVLDRSIHRSEGAWSDRPVIEQMQLSHFSYYV
jgi:hypothetical protein